MKTARLAGVAALLVGAALPTAFAGPIGSEVGPNLVTNGGFESNLSGWTASGFAGIDYDYGIDSVVAAPVANGSITNWVKPWGKMFMLS